MKTSRFLALAVVIALLAVPALALAQSQEEVDRKAADAEAATTRRVEADAVLLGLDRRLATAIAEYETVTAEMLDLTYGIAGREESIRAQERELADLRAAARRAAIDAYAESANTAWALSFDAPSLHATAITQVVLARTADRQTDAVTAFDDARAELAAERTALDEARSRVNRLRHDIDVMADDLEVLVAGAFDRLEVATATEQQAVAAHEQAAAEWEALKNSVSVRTFRWKELVERYFREDLVWEALQVMDCESRGNPEAMHPGSGASGLFQFLDGTWILASTLSGNAGASPFEPEANVAAAAWLVEHSERVNHWRGRWGHWVCQPVGWDTPPFDS